MHGLKRHSFVGRDKTVYQLWKQKYDKGMKPTINNLVAMAHVADVQRSADFYSQMGFRIVSTFKNDAGVLCWVDRRSGDAALMLAKANVPVIAGEQRAGCSILSVHRRLGRFARTASWEWRCCIQDFVSHLHGERRNSRSRPGWLCSIDWPNRLEVIHCRKN